jgi:hypothetical protein
MHFRQMNISIAGIRPRMNTSKTRFFCRFYSQFSPGAFELIALESSLIIIHTNGQIDLISLDLELLHSFSSKMKIKVVSCKVGKLGLEATEITIISKLGQQYFLEHFSAGSSGIKILNHHALPLADAPLAISIDEQERLHIICILIM